MTHSFHKTYQGVLRLLTDISPKDTSQSPQLPAQRLTYEKCLITFQRREDESRTNRDPGLATGIHDILDRVGFTNLSQEKIGLINSKCTRSYLISGFTEKHLFSNHKKKQLL